MLCAMRALSLACAAVALLAGTATAEPRVRAGLRWFLVQEKAMIGPNGGLQIGWFDLDLDFALIFLTEDDPAGALDGSFVGALLGVHPMIRALEVGPVELLAGTGFDAYGLWGIHSGEWKLGWPFLAEARVFVTENLGASLQLRIYALGSDGLEVGVDRGGEESAPLLLSIGVGGRWP